jgi:hypothetical protein
MNDLFEHKFAIKRLTKETDNGYYEAIQIYNDTTPVEIKTSTNEIAHWIRKEGKFKTMVFVLYLDNKVIGFSMIGYIVANKIAVIDYIALKPEYRLNSVFFSYISLLQDYFRESVIDVSYYINEISNKGEGKNIDKESKLFKKLICLEGFGKINSIYHTPPLGLTNHESEFESFLYIKTNDNIKQISRETYLDIVHSIYYDYFYEWYKDFLLDQKEINEYKQRLDNNFTAIKKNIVNNLSCDVTYAECPLISEQLVNEKTHGPLPKAKNKSPKIILILIPIILIVPVAIIYFYNIMLKVLNISFDSVSIIIGSYISAIVTTLSAFLISRKYHNF